MKIKQSVFLMAAIVVLMAIIAPLRASASVSDDQIVKSVKNTFIFKTFLKSDDVKIECKDGVVTLTGIVANSARKRLAEMTVEDIEGVKQVDNKLTLKGAEPTENSDAWVKEKVEATLALHRSVYDSRIEVSVLDGKVTLNGVAAGYPKKALATAYAEDVEGVLKVKNEMTVSIPRKSTRYKAEQHIDDASISAQVRYALMSHRSTASLNTKVKTENGVVTLTGKVNNRAEWSLLTLLANDVNGVQAVINLTTIEP